ncbi:MAG: MMPL family transporter, partial [Actinobacteria bacterium]|nr:MMPL family transporter [Actinomycetota bacterium]
NNSTFLPADTPSIQASKLAEPFQPTNLATATLVAYDSSGKLTSADEAAIARAETAVGKVDKVVRVIDLGTSSNGRASESLVELDVSLSGDPEADDAIAAIRDTFAKSLAGTSSLHLYLTGGVATNVDTNKQQASSQELTEVFSSLLILLLLFLTYRSFLAPIVNILPAALALGLADAVVAESSKIGVSVSSVTQAMLTVLILGAGTDYGLFLILRMREELRAGRTPKEAVVEAMAQVGESITFAALTVVGALLCLLVATFSLYSGLGPGLAIGVGIVALAALTLLPALLAIFGHALFWPKRWGEPKEDKTGLWERVGDHVIKHPVATLVGGVVLFGGLTVGAIGVGNAGFGSVGGGPKGSDSAAGSVVLAKNFPASALNPTSVLVRFRSPVWSNLQPTAIAEKEVASAGPFDSVSGPFNVNGIAVTEDELAALYRKLGPPGKLPVTPPASAKISKKAYDVYRAEAQYISADGKTVQFQTSLKAGDPGSTKALDAVPEMRSATTRIAREAGAAESGVSGLAPVSYDINKIANDDLVTILPIVLGVIAVLLALLVRSLIAPLYLIISVLLSYGAALGIACIIFVHIGGAAGVNFVLPFLLFIFLMALGEDYNILMMARIREEAAQRPLSEAIHRALHLTGTTITSAGVILAGTFAVSGILGSTSQLRQIGWAIALGVLMDTFLVRTLLVPSTALLLGRWNWWPSSLGRKT